MKDKLNRHLHLVHKYNNADVLRKQSELRVMYLWCRTEKHNIKHIVPIKAVIYKKANILALFIIIIIIIKNIYTG